MLMWILGAFAVIYLSVGLWWCVFATLTANVGQLPSVREYLMCLLGWPFFLRWAY